MSGNSIVDEHFRRNRTTMERWDVMAPHRTRVTRLVDEACAESGRSLCVLGAGNANDVDLAALAGKFGHIVLVDLDEAALDRVVERLSPQQAARVESRGGIDLTGLLATLEAWRNGSQPSLDAVREAIERAQATSPPDVGEFDVVASTCVLTQLVDTVCMALAADHPLRNELILAVRNRHLEMILECLRPGGVGVLVTDFVSTETAPELARIQESMLPQAAKRWIEQGNFFTGTNPKAIRDYYRNSVHSPLIEDVHVIEPWRWDIGPKQFAVAAVTLRRKA
jgi:hypothetical protein